jgi:hypothetical protein
MNAERLQSIIEFLLKAEEATKIKDRLSALRTHLTNLSSNPAYVDSQRQTVESLNALATTVNTFVAGLSPAQKANIRSVKGHEYFSNEMVADIKASLEKSSMTPGVVLQQVQKLFKDRQKYLETLRDVQESLNRLGIALEPLSPGGAEIGFLIPRSLFDNNLGEFQDELKTLNGIIRTFYEISNITPEPIDLRQLSSSDLIVVVAMRLGVIITLGNAMKWCSDTIKATMDIKKLIDAARALPVEQPIIDGLEGQMDKQIEPRVEAKVTEMLNGYTGHPHRKNELKGSLENSLHLLLERVANGMTVEIRLLPPPKKAEASPEEVERQAQFDQLTEIAKSLDFPQIPPGHPMLQITRREDDGDQAKRLGKAGKKTDE